MTPIAVAELTTHTVDGTGVFDLLMKANKAHLDEEYQKGRIRGPEFSTVYLGSLNAVMNASMQYVLTSRKIDLEASLLEQQIILAQVEVLKANIALQLMEAEKEKTAAEVLQIKAQTDLTIQQKVNLTAELPKIIAEVAEMGSRAQMTAQQVLNLTAEALNIPKQGLILDQQKANLLAENAHVVATTAMTTQQMANAVIEGTVLTATQCKLMAEYDLLIASNLKSAAELVLLNQKTATEKAQITSLGVDPDSVVGRQKALYAAQTAGFERDAEQKAAKLLVDTWNARRMTDDATVADGVNMLNDATVGRVVNKVLAGVNA